MAKRTRKEGAVRPLEAREALFAERYILCLNATQAAKEAGYSPRAARQQGARLMARASIKRAIAEAVRARTEAAGVTADRVLLELASIAYSDLRHILRVDDEGMVHVRPLDTLPENVTRAISEITQTSTEHFDEVAGHNVEKVRLGVKVHSKIEALKVLCKYLGLEAPTRTLNEHTGPGGAPMEVTARKGKLSDAVADMLMRKVLAGEREG